MQFIHPGGEHAPDDGLLKRWNVAQHRRKYLKSHGRYIAQGIACEGEIEFWGEWEPESRVTRRYERSDDDHPRFLYGPYYVDHHDHVWRQNTDPFVFGDHFHYTGCLQHTRRGPTQLRYLAPGSLILFGSCRQKQRFVLDTAFVVGDERIDHTLKDYERLRGRVSETYWTTTIEPWYRGDLPQDRSHRLYTAASHDRQYEAMYSFFPCRPYAEYSAGFARPAIELPGLITPHLTQGRKYTRDLSLPEMNALWNSVAKQVTDQGLALGVKADMPRLLPR